MAGTFEGSVTWAGLAASLLGLLGVLAVPFTASLVSYGSQMQRLTEDEARTASLDDRMTRLRERFEALNAQMATANQTLDRWAALGPQIRERFDNIDHALADLRVMDMRLGLGHQSVPPPP